MGEKKENRRACARSLSSPRGGGGAGVALALNLAARRDLYTSETDKRTSSIFSSGGRISRVFCFFASSGRGRRAEGRDGAAVPFGLETDEEKQKDRKVGGKRRRSRCVYILYVYIESAASSERHLPSGRRSSHEHAKRAFLLFREEKQMNSSFLRECE